MAIRYERVPVALYGRLGQLAGQSMQARREQEMAQENINRIRAMQHDQTMAEFRANLDLQAEMRSRQWELQKAEINSQYDLQERLRMESILKERDLRKKIERMEQYEKVVAEIENLLPEGAGIVPLSSENQALKQNLLLQASFEREGFDISVPRPQQQTAEQARLERFRQLISPTVSPQIAQGVGGEQINIIAPDGTPGTIPEYAWPQYEALGFKRTSLTPKPTEKPYKIDVPIEGYGIPFGMAGL